MAKVLTDEQIEIAARKLCDIRGFDPANARLWRRTNISPYDEIKKHLEIEQAIAHAFKTTPQEGDRK